MPDATMSQSRVYSKYYNPEKKRAYYLRNKDAALKRARKWALNNPEKRKEVQRNLRARHRRFGVCPLCKTDGLLTFDHCHQTGLERGWICRQCNCMLGMARDKTTTLERAIEYLQAFARRHDVSI